MSMILRTIIILPILLFLFAFGFIMTAMLDPFYAVVQGSVPAQNVWGGVEGTTYWMYGFSFAIFILGLLAWHVFAPIRDDVDRRRI